MIRMPKDGGYVAPWLQNPAEVRDCDKRIAGGRMSHKAVEYDERHAKWHQSY